jgi:signal transduction histidine kinase
MDGEAPPDAGVDRRKVHELVRSLTLLTDPDELMQRVGDGLQELFGPDLVLVFQTEPGGERFTPGYQKGFDPEALRDVAFSTRGSLARSLSGRDRCIALARELDLLDHLDAHEREMLGTLRAQLCAPLISLGRLIGMVLLGSTDPQWRLAEEDRQLLEMLTAQAALALESAVLHSQQRDRLHRLYRAERLATAGKLAAGVAHEIRNPLTVISSTVQYILQGIPEDDPRRGLTEAVLHEVSRMNRTVEGLISLGRVREARKIEVNLLDPLDQARLLVEGQARQRQVRIEKRYGAKRFLMLGDPDLLQQVFLNLLLNAIQATEADGSVTIRAVPWDDPYAPGRKVQVEIADTGRGIPEEDRDRIFDPFFTTKSEGTGLGLPICQSIVERMEGEIDLHSQPGRGTTVCVRFPRID